MGLLPFSSRKLGEIMFVATKMAFADPRRVLASNSYRLWVGNL